MSFGDILRNLLNDRGIMQKQLALDLNIAASTIGNYIQHSREPDFETLKRLASYFHVTIDYLLDYRSEKADTHAEDELLCIFRSLTIDQQELYLEQGKVMVKLNSKKSAESLKSTS